jgi:hypothetical protein
MSSENNKSKISRWYDRNDSISVSMHLLESVPDNLKRQVANYLIEDLITKKPYSDMLPIDVHYLVLSENRRRRWYDFDESVRIFVELLRHSSESQRLEISDKLEGFIKKILETPETQDITDGQVEEYEETT